MPRQIYSLMQYKKQQEVLRKKSSAKQRQANDSFEECLKDNAEDIDLEKFLNNLKTLKEQIPSNEEASMSKFKNPKSQKQGANEVGSKVMKNLRVKEPMKSSSFLRPVSPNKAKDNPNGKPSQATNGKSAEIQEKDFVKLEKEISKLLRTERSRSYNTLRMNERQFNDFYRNLERKATEAQDKIEEKRKQKLAEEKRQTTFRPQIIRKNETAPELPQPTKIIEKSDRFLASKNMKLEQRQRDKELLEELEYQRNCTFHPEINESIPVKRSLTDIIQWTGHLQQKHKSLVDQKEKAIKQECSFRPKINANYMRSSISSHSQENFRNIGEKLYSKYKVKTQEKSAEKLARTLSRSKSPSSAPQQKHSFTQTQKSKSPTISLSMSKKVTCKSPLVESNGLNEVRKSSEISNLNMMRQSSEQMLKQAQQTVAQNDTQSKTDSKLVNKSQPMTKPTVPKINRPAIKNDQAKINDKKQPQSRDQKQAQSKEKKAARKFYNGECMVQNIEDIVHQINDIEQYFDV